MRALQSWLLEANLVRPEDLQAVQSKDPALQGYSLASALLEQELIDEGQLVATVSERLGVAAAPHRLHRAAIAASVLSGIPEDLCWQHHVFPFGIDRTTGRLQVAMADPSDEDAKRTLQSTLGYLPAVYVIGPRQLEKAIRKHYLDSWVEETRGNARRFFGYDNITNPGADPKRAAPKQGSTAPLPQAPAIAPEPALGVEPVEADEEELTRRVDESGRVDLADTGHAAEPDTSHAAGTDVSAGPSAGPETVPDQGYPTDAVSVSKPTAASAPLGRVALRESSARDRLATLEQALGDLLELLAELPDERVSSTAAAIRKRLKGQ